MCIDNVAVGVDAEQEWVYRSQATLLRLSGSTYDWQRYRCKRAGSGKRLYPSATL